MSAALREPSSEVPALGRRAAGSSASTESDSVNYAAHSDVERLLETSLYGLVEFTWRATMEVAAKK
jgi:hypothetical protein